MDKQKKIIIIFIKIQKNNKKNKNNIGNHKKNYIFTTP